MKKITSILLAIIMVLSTFSLFAFAKEEKVPVVVLQGYSGPTLVYADDNGEPIIDPETGDVIKAWPLDFGKIGEKVVCNQRPLSLRLGPGLVGTIYDGIQRPLKSMYEDAGAFLLPGQRTEPLDAQKKSRTISS